MLVYDTETNGFLEELDTIHCLWIKDRVTGTMHDFADQPGYRPVSEGLKMLMEAAEGGRPCVAHNAEGFDYPAIRKVYPWFELPENKRWDSLIWSQLVYADLKDRDYRKGMDKKLPRNLVGRHSMEAWGIRLNRPKDDYSARMKAKGLDPWAEWNEDMHAYCGMDVETNDALIVQLIKHDFSTESIMLEHETRRILNRQEQNPWHFNVKEAERLYAEWAGRREEIRQQLQEIFPPFYVRDGGKWVTPKKTLNYKDPLRADRTEGAAFCPVKLIDFNPGSAQQIVNRLQTLYGWEPKEFTKPSQKYPDGQPKMDEEVLKTVTFEYPQLKPLEEFAVLDKRCSQLAEGKQAWLKKQKDGKLYHRVNSMGAVTGRMTHSNPNLAQVPASYSPYGAECRALFMPRPGWKLVGIDADGLELRDMAGYMAKWDGGEYIEAVLRGKKEEGTDPHSRNRDILQLGAEHRVVAKTWFYGLIYGAGDVKLGLIANEAFKRRGLSKQKVARGGRMLRRRLMEGLPALGELTRRVKDKAQKQGWLRGLDGRKLWVRHQHAALNTLLQATGAIQMKKALTIFDRLLQEEGYVPGEDYEFVGNVHDEWQVECRPDIAERVGALGTDAIRLAGEHFNFACPLAGNADIGDNWAQTH